MNRRKTTVNPKLTVQLETKGTGAAGTNGTDGNDGALKPLASGNSSVTELLCNWRQRSIKVDTGAAGTDGTDENDGATGATVTKEYRCIREVQGETVDLELYKVLRCPRNQGSNPELRCN